MYKRQGQLVAQEASRRLNAPFGIIDLSLAPTPAIGDSIAEIFQEMGLEEAGAPGTTAALAILNDNVKKGGVMALSLIHIFILTTLMRGNGVIGGVYEIFVGGLMLGAFFMATDYVTSPISAKGQVIFAV